VFPRDPLLLAQLPGIGVSTAAAIAAFAYGVRAAILDGNVKRVLARVFGIDDDIDSAPVQRRLWQQARALLPQSDIEAYTQGLMDLGATICTRTRPACAECPLRQRCVALAQDRVAQLPRRRPKPPRPEKHVTLLLVLDHGQVLLQQRPPSGIWGGLLSLPEVEPLPATWPDAAVPAALLRALEPIGVLAQAQPLPAFTHVFTHFRLQITPLRITLQRRAALVGQLAQAWYGPAQLAQAALPAPVRRLLLHVLPPVPA
jgi:A/G-specific adenine glycosylase